MLWIVKCCLTNWTISGDKALAVSIVDISFAIVALLVLLVGAGYFASLFSTWHSDQVDAPPTADPEVIALMDQKVHLLEDLRDLEMDFQMGKIPEPAYRRDKMRLEPLAIAVLKELERRGLGPKDDDSFLLDNDGEDLDVL